MRKDIELAKKLQKIMAKSKRCLVIAKRHHNEGEYEEAASRAYYAIFHSLQASLLTIGLSFSKHSSVKGAFNKEFVHKGTFSKEFTEKIERIFEDRQVGDYGYEAAISKTDSEADTTDAETIVKAIEEYLVAKSFL